MQGNSFLQDLAVVMITAGAVTLLFHRLKQPVVLGYLLAGFIIGPHTPPFSFIRDTITIQTMADLGVVFLMFSLGLEFSFRKLKAMGLSALVIAGFEIMVMIFAGYLMGAAFGWSKSDCLFLGIMLSLTSTMIVVKSLRDRDEMKTRHAELIAGVSLFDDIFVIMLMVALPGFALTGSIPTLNLILMLTGLTIFLVGAVVVGLLVVPRLMKYIARYTTDETLLIVSLGLCFGLSLFAVKLQFSAALGAFLIGAIVAESRQVGKVIHLTIPLRDMFCAVFFVAIGMQINPDHLAGSILPALAITGGYFIFKITSCAFGAFMTGVNARTSMKVGTNMAQLGEFAFILATLGVTLNLVSEFMYPLIVTVASLNALIRPYLVDNADRLAVWVGRMLPTPLVTQLTFYRRKMAELGGHKPKKSAMRHVWSLAIQIALNLVLISGGFITAGYVNRTFPHLLAFVPEVWGGSHSLVWLGIAVLLLPLYIATFRKMQAMAMMLSELMTSGASERRSQRVFRAALNGVILGVQVIIMAILTLIVSAALLPPWQSLIVLLLIIAVLIFRYGREFNRWYSEGKFALIATFNEPLPDPSADRVVTTTHISNAHLQKVTISKGVHDGQLIRELQLRSVTGASIVAIERNGKSIINPGPDTELMVGDQVLLLGDSHQLVGAVKMLERNLNEDNEL